MNTRVLVLVLVLPLLMAGGPKKDLKFKEFAPKGGGFSVLMPGDPKEQKQTVNTPAGNIDIILNIVEITPQNNYVVAHSDYPAAAVKAGSEEKMLDGARDGAVRNSKGKLLSEKRIKIGKYPGREIVIEAPGQGQLRNRIYLVEQRIYQVMVTGTKDQVTSKDTDKYLESFKLTKK